MTTIHPTSDNYPYSFADATEVPVRVPDVSHWQGDIDADKFISAGAHGVIIRAGFAGSAGGSHEDSKFKINAAKFQGKIPMGAYWYYRPEVDAVDQADKFCSLMKRFDLHIPPVADVESNTQGFYPASFTQKLHAFLLRVQVAHGIKPTIYTRASFWNPCLGDPPWAGDYDLWIARYATLPKPWGNPGDPSWTTPSSWDTWRLWQWSADGNGRGAEFGAESDDIDLNRYNGSLDQFYQWCGWKQEPPPPDDPEEPCKCCDVLRKIYELAKRYI